MPSRLFDFGIPSIKQILSSLQVFSTMNKENCFVHYCNNHTINSILTIYIQRAKREKIEVTTKIEIKYKYW